MTVAVERLPSWAVALTEQTQEWLLRLEDDVLRDPRLWLALQSFMGAPQTDATLAALRATVEELRVRDERYGS